MRYTLSLLLVGFVAAMGACQPSYDLTSASLVSCKQMARDTMPDYQSDLPGLDTPSTGISITVVCMCEYTLRGGVSPLYDTDRRDIVSRSLGTTGDPQAFCRQQVFCKTVCPQETH